jgi:uncharacterized protein (DUF433 family)
MATAAKTVYAHITKDPAIRRGKACIDDTRIPVVALVALLKEGKTAEHMLVEYPDLSPAQVHAALAYYYDHRDEIETDLAEDDDAEREHERHRAEYLSRRRP